MNLSDLRPLLEQALSILQGMGPFAYLAMVPLFFLWSTFFLPGGVLFLASGILFGLPAGFAIVSLGSVTAAGLHFLAGRHFTRGKIAYKASHSAKIKAIDDLVSEKGWRMVLLLRLSTLLPFPVMNYGLGLSRISFREYLWSSWLGMMPGTLIYVYLGHSAGHLIMEPSRPVEPIEWILPLLGLLATIGVGIYAAAILKKALKQPPAHPVQ